MSFTSQTYLKAFCSNTGILTKGSEPVGTTEAYAQADELIYQKTGVAIPADAANANAKLRNIANALVIWFTTGMQDSLSEHEYKFRRDLFNDAMSMLDKIHDGSEPLIDGTGVVISNPTKPSTYFESTQRVTGAL